MQCSKCQHERLETDFYKRPDRPSGRMTYCKRCYNMYCRDRWVKKKLDAIAYKGGRCVKCQLIATNSNYVVFDFHHSDPTTKVVEWDKLRLRDWKNIKTELDKCVCVCSNCHRLLHYESGALNRNRTYIKDLEDPGSIH
jgi:hypothetical protein